MAIGLGLMGFWMVLSLAGGPSALLFHAVPQLPLLRTRIGARRRRGFGGGADRVSASWSSVAATGTSESL